MTTRHTGRTGLSMLAAWRAAKAMGYRRMITYTLPHESGASLRAAGFVQSGVTRPNPHGWNSPTRPRDIPAMYPFGEKMRWEIAKRSSEGKC